VLAGKLETSIRNPSGGAYLSNAGYRKIEWNPYPIV